VSRAGVTLLELLVAISIMVMVMGSLGAMAKAVNQGAAYGESYGTATQHARVSIERISASVRGATASDAFPGLLVIAQKVDGYDFPDTLVVWHPDGTAVDPDGLPRMNELRIYCPDPDALNELLEITVPGDTRVVPLPTDRAAWLTEIANLKSSDTAARTRLTDMVRVSAVNALASTRRGAVRFNVRYRPTDQEMADYAAKTAAWQDLAWPQGIYTSNMGLRQAWLRMELQILPASTSAGLGSEDATAIPFLGSASRFYEVHP
jgi:hypothetical protein